ncbi:MAG: YtxH domain-containing protein [Candidatus Krumholzibacteriia bacterium]
MMAFVLGAAMGGATALLMAPDKGEVTRQRIRASGSKAMSNGAAVVDNAKSSVEDAGHAISQSARHHASAVGDAFTAAKETYAREKNSA